MNNALELDFAQIVIEPRRKNSSAGSSVGFKIASAPLGRPVRIPIQFFKPVIVPVKVSVTAVLQTSNRFSTPVYEPPIHS